jgi:hypothetical protein
VVRPKKKYGLASARTGERDDGGEHELDFNHGGHR